MGEGAAAEVDVDVIKGQALCLVDRQSPGEAQRKLLERSGNGADDLLLIFVISIAAGLPRSLLDLILLAGDLDPDALVVKAGDAGDGAVDPARRSGSLRMRMTLAPALQDERRIGRLGRLAEIAGDTGLEGVTAARQGSRDKPC